ncbi:MAG: hypothetical protein EHM28_02580, partial [Spirochaetaceae bacterium]
MEISGQLFPLVVLIDGHYAIQSKSSHSETYLPGFNAVQGDDLSLVVSTHISKHHAAIVSNDGQATGKPDKTAKHILAESISSGEPGILEWTEETGNITRMRILPAADKKSAYVIFEDISAEWKQKNMLAVRRVFEELIKDLSQVLADIQFLDNRWLRYFLKKLACFLGADKSFLVMDKTNKQEEWVAFTYPVPSENEESQGPDMDSLSIRAVAEKVHEIAGPGYPVFYHAPDAKESPFTRELEKFYQEHIQHKTGPCIILPFAAHGRFIGFFLFTCLEGKSFTWPEQFLDILSHISTMVAVRIDREAALRELQETKEDRQKLQDRFILAQKMDAIGRLAAGIAHDFNNILGGILGHAALLLEEAKTHPVVPYYAEGIIKATERASVLTQQLLVFSKKQNVAPRNIEPNKALSEATKMIRRVLGEDIIFSFDPAPLVAPILFDPSQFDHVILNVVVNSREAMPKGGTLSISTYMVKAKDLPEAFAEKATVTDYVCIRITDTGSGMDDKTKTSLFEPFFTTRQNEGHRGLGLSTVYSIIIQNQGFIHVDTSEGQGTTVRLFIPGVLNQSEAAEKPATLMDFSSKTILVVEDEPDLRTILIR